MTSGQEVESRSMRPFFTLWGGQAASLLGSQLVQFALIWWLTQETGSGTVLAIASIAGLIPAVLLGPFAGVLVDRWNRRITMMVSDAVVTLATVVLAILFWSGNVEIWHVYVILFIRSLAGTFQSPAMQASTTLMVPEENLARVQGLNQMLQGALSIVAAPLGALLVSVFPIQAVLAIDIVTAAVAIGVLFMVAVPEPKRAIVDATVSSWNSFWSDMGAGFRYVWSWPGLLVMMGLSMLVNMVLGPSSSLLPLLVTQRFGGTAYHLGALESIFGIGLLLGGLALSVWGGFKRRIVTALIGILGLGIGFLIIGLAPASLFAVAVAGSFIVGMMVSFANGPTMAIMQAIVEPSMQGRVFTLLGSASMAMMPIGLAIAGPLSDEVGVETWFIIGGAVTTLVGLAAFFLPSVMHIEDGPPSSVVLPSVVSGAITAPELGQTTAD